ncbi:MAG TPA: alpha/beta fold hydrolase [Candidatus Babeliales bacterium]|nr:alpha/beta fold hydrolase [Candidatus Babeliales bacterium]
MFSLKFTKKDVIKSSFFFMVVFVCFFCREIFCEDMENIMCDNAQNNIYGAVLEEKTKTANGLIVERVIVHSQEAYDSTKKITRNGVLARNNEAQATILICHGFMCDKYDVGILRKVFKKSQFNVMTFDFRAHGQAGQGQYCTFGRDEALDVIAAARFLRNHPELQNIPLFAYGFSMGAVSAIEAQALASDLFDGMILDCPFDSSERVIKTGLEGLKCSFFGYEFYLPGRDLLQKYAFHPYVQALVKTVLKTVAQMDATGINTNFCPLHPAESVKNITIPLFFIHCKNDQKVSVDQVKSVYEGAAGYKRLWLTNGRRHYDSYFYNPEKYTEQVRQFYYDVINGDIATMPKQGVVEDDEDDDHLFG